MSVLDFASTTGWAMLEERAEQLAEVAERFHTSSPDVLEAYRAQALERSQRAKVRDGTAILYIEGPLFKKANLMVEFCGATSYEMVRKDFQAAIDDDSVHSIVLMIDSPGGQANGCDELAAAIFAARGTKPITSYVSGMAASGGYWIAAAADEIVVSDGALLGSIGVVLGVEDRSPGDERRGVKNYQFVSSQSPGKRPDPGTEAGASQIQTMVDDLADVFISAIATYRGITVEDVIAKFGAGGLKVGAKAVAAGMADKVGSFEGVIASLNDRGSKGRFSNSPGGFRMDDNTKGPTADEISASATASAQTRMKTILASESAKTLPTVANFLAFDTTISADVSTKILEAAAKDMPKVEDKPEGQQEQQQQRDYGDHKADSGALGLSQPQAHQTEQQAAVAGWGSAMKAAEQSRGL